ncbi:MAG: hypothetical protein KME15_23040 [Drouetiella hepatica Uher 2000/2452]|jgi:hypothetical protein|uniref:Uncharacterized protein n=1 Tax=Drouetiella hepatica Uher 2000/2452 TaxID=904376 RepID=A0A951QE29_9CYAN|nr:hypothetical protein [Drouetiella hepatica Uher 2000/2452]
MTVGSCNDALPLLNLERILRDDRLLRAMTGLNRKAFENLLPSFSEVYRQSQMKPDVERQRAPGGGEKQPYEPVATSCFTFCCTANAILPST